MTGVAFSLTRILFNFQINWLLFFKMTDTNNDPSLCREQFDRLLACVIIPTYNNGTSLAGVITDVAQYTSNIIVVNDGSTDNTNATIDSFSFVQSISYTKNVGKGWALRQAIAMAGEKGYHYAITIDSDGQHFAKDLPTFIAKLSDEKNGSLFVSVILKKRSQLIWKLNNILVNENGTPVIIFHYSTFVFKILTLITP